MQHSLLAVCLVVLVSIAIVDVAAQKQGGMDAAMLAEGQKGVGFYEQGRYEEAIAVFKKMEKKIPKDHQVDPDREHRGSARVNRYRTSCVWECACVCAYPHRDV